MMVSRWYRELRAAIRTAAAAAGLGAALLLVPVQAGAAEAGAAEAGAKPAAKPVKKVSPYARYAQERAKNEQAKPARVKATSSSMRGPGNRRGRH